MATQRKRAIQSIACVVAVLLVGSAFAGDKRTTHPIDLTQPAAAATIERICDQAVINIGLRYNLNEKQQEETDRIMKKYVHSFLKEHEDEIWPAIRELLANNLKPPESDEELRRLGESARKLAKLAYKAVKEGNAEWRKILSDEQKRVHDYDLAELDKTFAQMDQNFGEWADGRRTKDPIFRTRDPRVVEGPPKPPMPLGNEIPRGESVPFELTVFDTFVEGFIKDYELDAAQIVAAHSILRETKTHAKDFRSTNEDKFRQNEEARNKAIAEKNREDQKKLDTERRKLMEPVYVMFAQMESRLKDLLTTAQIERHQAKAKAATDGGRRIVRKDQAPKKKKPDSTPAKSDKKSDALAADPRTSNDK